MEGKGKSIIMGVIYIYVAFALGVASGAAAAGWGLNWGDWV